MRSILVLLAFATFAHAGFWDDCEIDLDVSFMGYYNDEIPDNYDKVIIKTIKKLEITNITITDGKYIYAEIDGDNIHFKTSPHFENLEKEVSNYANYYYDVTLRSEMDFHCAAGATSLTFHQPIKDINNHVPFFNRELYTFKFGMDVPAGFELTKLMSISAIDIDFTDEYIDFAVDGEYLEIEEGYYDDDDTGKVHRAELVAKKDIVGPFDETFKITAKDEREKNLEGEAMVRIWIVKENDD